jgi:phosphatidyl-myo-inositol dimannoside synthase
VLIGQARPPIDLAERLRRALYQLAVGRNLLSKLGYFVSGHLFTSLRGHHTRSPRRPIPTSMPIIESVADALMVTTSFLPGRGGIESFLAELCALVAPRVAVLAPAKRDGKPIPENLGYPTLGHPGSMLPIDRTADAIERAAAEQNANKVLLGTPWPLILLGPKLKKRGLGYASLVYGAETLVPSAVPGLNRLLAGSLAGADLLLPISEFTAGVARNLLQKKRQHVPPMDLVRAQIDVNRFNPDVAAAAVRRKLQLSPQERVVLCFGRLVKRKGVDRMIKAMPEIARREPRAMLVVAGAGPEEPALRRLADRYGRVCFAGRVSEDEAAAVYALADVFALPVVDRWFGLEAEGLGVVLLEAQACGVPCVAGRSGGSPEAVIDGETGFVVDATRQEDLVDKVSWLLGHPHEAAEMGQRGRSFVQREYSALKPPVRLLDWLSS